jgi:hypothetical protein
MRIRKRLATVIGGLAFAGLAAFGVGAATPAGAQQAKPAAQAASVTPQQANLTQGCWGDDCWDDDWGWDNGWDDWYGWGW